MQNVDLRSLHNQHNQKIKIHNQILLEASNMTKHILFYITTSSKGFQVVAHIVLLYHSYIYSNRFGKNLHPLIDGQNAA